MCTSFYYTIAHLFKVSAIYPTLLIILCQVIISIFEKTKLRNENHVRNSFFKNKQKKYCENR